MTNNCSCCNKKIGFFEVDYNEVDNFILCENCNSLFYKYKNGQILLDEIKSTNINFINYLKTISPDLHITENLIQERNNQNIKQELQKINPLYDDIHQIANDIHFIKNVVLIGIIVTIIGIFLSIIM